MAGSQIKKKSMVSPGNYLREVRSELRKVSWPTKDEVISSTIIVLVLLIILSAFIGSLDYIFTVILKLVSS